MAVEVLVEGGFVKAVTLAGEAFDTVAVDSVMEFLFGSCNKNLSRGARRQ